MIGDWGYSSEKINSNRIETPTRTYFPFGDEREKLKNYVFQQLHGDQANKNAEILRKFQEQASIRRHRYLHRHSYTEQPQLITKRSDEIYQPFPKITSNNNQYRFANFFPRQFKPYNLIPTEKTPPPIYNFDIHDLSGEQTKRMKTIKNFNPQRSPNMYQTIKYKETVDTNRPKQQKRGQSLDIRSSYKDKALQKIKQIANQRKNGITHKQQSVHSTNSSQILEQLQYKKEKSKVQFKHLQKRLQKFHKYRNYLRKVQKYNF